MTIFPVLIDSPSYFKILLSKMRLVDCFALFGADLHDLIMVIHP